jgi:hypothetical protein
MTIKVMLVLLNKTIVIMFTTKEDKAKERRCANFMLNKGI